MSHVIHIFVTKAIVSSLKSPRWAVEKAGTADLMLSGLSDTPYYWAVFLVCISPHRETSHLINCGEIPC